MFGLYYLVRDLVVSVAAFGRAIRWSIGPEMNLLVAFGLGMAGTLCFAWRGKDLGAGSRQGAAPS